MLATLAHLAAVRTGSEGAVLHHALYAALLAAELHLAPADADDRAADPAWTDAERRINDRARELIDQARRAIRKAEHHQDAWAPTPGGTERWFAVGDTVRLKVSQSGTWIDEDLAAEESDEEEARVRVTARVGTVGRVTVVRSYSTPLPYVVMFGDQEIGVPEGALERVAPAELASGGAR
jgi:hypothetical protein